MDIQDDRQIKYICSDIRVNQSLSTKKLVAKMHELLTWAPADAARFPNELKLLYIASSKLIGQAI